MKKTLFALFAVLLASFLATCDLLEPFSDTDDDPPDSAKDGMATLRINVKDGGIVRGLNSGNAKQGNGAANYYEVVFKKGTEYYQVAFDASSTNQTDREITIPIANYDVNTNRNNDAVIFGGFKDTNGDYILLGVGTIYSTAGGSGAGTNANITKDTTGVTFSLTALKNDVGSANSTFEITGPTKHVVNNHWSYATNKSNIPKASNGVPLFPIPGTLSGVSSGFRSGGYTNPDTRGEGTITAKYSVNIPARSDAVILQSDWTATDITSQVSLPEASIGGGTVTCTRCYDPETKGTTTGAALQATSTFTFDIDVQSVTVDGLCAVLIDATVYALSPTHKTGSTLTWHIRGGTSKTIPDDGSGNGAAVVLAVGTHYPPTSP